MQFVISAASFTYRLSLILHHRHPLSILFCSWEKPGSTAHGRSSSRKFHIRFWEQRYSHGQGRQLRRRRSPVEDQELRSHLVPGSWDHWWPLASRVPPHMAYYCSDHPPCLPHDACTSRVPQSGFLLFALYIIQPKVCFIYPQTTTLMWVHFHEHNSALVTFS